jgi:hypothetical protein
MFNHPPAANRLAELGLTVHTVYAQLMRYLLRPKPSTLDFIHQYSSFFALPSIYSVGIHIRTGDQSMVRFLRGPLLQGNSLTFSSLQESAEGDAGNVCFPSSYHEISGSRDFTLQTVDRYRYFFNCADAAAGSFSFSLSLLFILTTFPLLAATYAQPGQRVVYYLITDSAHLRNEAVKAFADKIVISGLHQQHGEEFVPDEEVS